MRQSSKPPIFWCSSTTGLSGQQSEQRCSDWHLGQSICNPFTKLKNVIPLKWQCGVSLWTNWNNSNFVSTQSALKKECFNRHLTCSLPPWCKSVQISYQSCAICCQKEELWRNWIRPLTLPLSRLSTSCTWSAVDLYGHIARWWWPVGCISACVYSLNQLRTLKWLWFVCRYLFTPSLKLLLWV